MAPATQHSISCPQCDGFGVFDSGRRCTTCGGMGVGTFVGSYFFFWRDDLSSGALVVQQSILWLRRLSRYLAFVIGAAGMIALAFWLEKTAVSGWWSIKTAPLVSFWGEVDPLLILFWVGIIALLYAWYVGVRLREIDQCAALPRIAPARFSGQGAANNWEQLQTAANNINVRDGLSAQTRRALAAAALQAQMRGGELTPLLFLAAVVSGDGTLNLAYDADVLALFSRLDIHRGNFLPRLQNMVPALNDGKASVNTPRVGMNMRQSLVAAYLDNHERAYGCVTPSDLISFFAQYDPDIRELLTAYHVSYQDVSRVNHWLRRRVRVAQRQQAYEQQKRLRLPERLHAAAAAATPVLDYFADDITLAARRGAYMALAVRPEADSLQAIIATDKRIALIGPAGSGRRSLLHLFAEQIVSPNAPRPLRQRRLLLLNAAKLAGEAAGVDAEQKFAVLADELRRAPQTILALENVDAAFWQLAERFVPARTTLIATAVADPSGGRATLITLTPPDEDSLFTMLAAAAIIAEAASGVYISYAALTLDQEAVTKYLPHETQPAAAVATLHAAVRRAADEVDKRLTPRLVAQVISERANIPFTKILRAGSA